MLKEKDYAFQLKVTLDSIFDYDEGNLGGLASIEFIEENPFVPITLILGHFYNKVDKSFKKKIDRFFEKYYLAIGKSISEIGNKKIGYILADFKRIVSTI